ncbi:hypothetical protein NBRC116592_03250 [Colwellia sp. KU-HH00111]|uniref:DUF1289 domain-containing protein n=1 Tax=Colwellia sp. KU-HH00111 TaxID=3127652 RepID=UPI003104C29A
MQLEFFEIPSPCVGVCQSDEKGYCLGCMRTRDERQNWVNLDNDNKQKIIKRCIQRKKRKANKGVATKGAHTTSSQEQHQVEQPSLLDPPSKHKLATDSDLDFNDFEL